MGPASAFHPPTTIGKPGSNFPPWTGQPIAFPETVLQSSNFAPLNRGGNDKPLRLKNVATVLDWYPRGSPPEHYMVVVTLGEAETLRCLIRDTDHVDGPPMALLLLSTNTLLEATPNS